MKKTLLLGLIAACQAQAQTLPPSLFLPELVLPREVVDTSSFPVTLPTAAAKAPISGLRYNYEGVSKSLAQYQDDAKVRAMLVIKDGKIVYEYNKFPYTKTSQHQIGRAHV